MRNEVIEQAEKNVIQRAGKIAYNNSEHVGDREIQSALYNLAKDYIILGARLMQEELLKLEGK